MRILIFSDIHANPWAIRAIEQESGHWDHVLFLGDAVNYGPDPRGALAWLRDRRAIGVRGNHDQAVATGADPKASPAKQPLALAMRDWTHDQLDTDDLDWLVRLPITLTWEIAGCRLALVHATPSDPLYDYRVAPQASDHLLREITGAIKADVLLMGHTHRPFLRQLGKVTITNPGSAGQPLDGDPRAAYAMWEDGRITLGWAAYDQMACVKCLSELPLPAAHREQLIAILHAGQIG